MNTFRKFLLSYVGTLLLPVLILSIVISNVLFDFCTDQVLTQNTAALEQLRLSFEIQRGQMDAYAIQTTTRSEFFARNQSQVGDMYSIQHILNQWLMADAFVEDVYYYNTKLQKVYGTNAVYTLQDFVAWPLQDEVSCERLSAVLASSLNSAWIRFGEGGRELLYCASARMSQNERGWLLFRASQEVLGSMVSGTALYPQSLIAISQADGSFLYGNREEPDAAYLAQAEASGVILVNGQRMLYTRVEGDGQVYLSVVPYNVIFSHLQATWNMFCIGILVIGLVGAMAIAYAMRLNYHPIKELENTVLDARVLDAPGNDAVTNVHQAFLQIQQRNRHMARQTAAIDQERVIFRLLLGAYQTAEEFNRDAEGAGLRLSEGPLYLAALCAEGEDAEAFARAAIRETQAYWGDGRPVMYVEIPEKQEVILVVAGTPNPAEAADLAERLGRAGIAAHIWESEPCEAPSQLADQWRSRFAQGQQPDEERPGVLPPKVLDMFSNALAFGETDRIQFVTEGIRTMLPGVSAAETGLLLMQLLYIARSSEVCDPKLQKTLDALPARIAALPSGSEPAEAILRDLCDALCAALAPDAVEQNENLLCQQIAAYLEAHFQDENLSVQSAADAFSISLSNLSHYFKSHMGVSVSSYIENLRISYSQQLLRTTAMGVSQIAAEVGYAQPATYMRAFKKIVGMSPTTWRKQTEKQA